MVFTLKQYPELGKLKILYDKDNKIEGFNPNSWKVCRWCALYKHDACPDIDPDCGEKEYIIVEGE